MGGSEQTRQGESMMTVQAAVHELLRLSDLAQARGMTLRYASEAEIAILWRAGQSGEALRLRPLGMILLVGTSSLDDPLFTPRILLPEALMREANHRMLPIVVPLVMRAIEALFAGSPWCWGLLLSGEVRFEALPPQAAPDYCDRPTAPLPALPVPELARRIEDFIESGRTLGTKIARSRLA